MSSLIERVARYASQQRLWAADVRVVAAVSGGSDSVALLFLLRELAARGELILAALAHLNHQIRGDAAEADAGFCRALAARLDIPAIVGDADVPVLAQRNNVSLEVAARDARQQFYAEAMRTARAACVALAHTRDDQAETILLRLTRGTGTFGLAGMAPRRGHLVRPVLEVTRRELQDYLGSIGESWREDETNRDRAIPRNRVRHEVLPNLRAINPNADAALARAGGLLRADAELLETLANAAYIQIVSAAADVPAERWRKRPAGDKDDVVVKAGELTRLPAALATRVARYALETANPDGSYGVEDARALCAFAAGDGVSTLPGLRVERFGGNEVLLSRVHNVHGVHQVHAVRGASVDFPELKLGIPGTVEAPFGGWAVSAEGPMTPPPSFDRGPTTAIVDAAQLGDRLIVRLRRPGDRLQPLGAPGRRKVQDVLVDRKVPKDDRDHVPIVTTEKGDIVWVAGQVLADRFRVTSLTARVVILTLRRMHPPMQNPHHGAPA